MFCVAASVREAEDRNNTLSARNDRVRGAWAMPEVAALACTPAPRKLVQHRAQSTAHNDQRQAQPPSRRRSGAGLPMPNPCT